MSRIWLKYTDEEKLYVALDDLVGELRQWDTPQRDREGKFSEDTALGYAIKVLKEVKTNVR